MEPTQNEEIDQPTLKNEIPTQLDFLGATDQSKEFWLEFQKRTGRSQQELVSFHQEFCVSWKQKSIFLPTLNHYIFADIQLDCHAEGFEQFKEGWQRECHGNCLIKMDAVKQQDLFTQQRAAFEQLFDFFHSAVDLNTAFELNETYINMFQQLCNSSLAIFKFRFVDIGLLEMLRLAVFLIPVSFSLVAEVLKTARTQWRSKWFTVLDEATSLPSIYDQEDDDYYIRWQPVSSNFKRRVPFNPVLVSRAFEWPVNAAQQPDKLVYVQLPSKVVLEMLNLVHECAVQFNCDHLLSQSSDIEAEARLSPTAKRVLQEKNLEIIFQAFSELPFAATASLNAMLDFLSSHPRKYETRWMARQLKMGLGLYNPYGRLAWHRLISSLLYTYECIAKFRRDSEAVHNIYHLDHPSYSRGPEDNRTGNLECRIEFRDDKWFTEDKLGDKIDDPNFWFGILTYHQRITQKSYKLCLESFSEYAQHVQKGFDQFVRVPYVFDKTLTSKGKKGRKAVWSMEPGADIKVGVHDLKEITWYLDPVGSERHVRLGNVYRMKPNQPPRFCLYLRYYVFSTATGADHIFYYRSTHNTSRCLYSKIPGAGRVQFSRADTCGILEWYLQMVYSKMNKTFRSGLKAVQPEADVAILFEFWKMCHWAQDSIIMCLELQQRFLYLHHRELLEKELVLLAEERNRNMKVRGIQDPLQHDYAVRTQFVLTALMTNLFEPDVYIEGQGLKLRHERMEWVDIVLRRYILHAFVQQLKDDPDGWDIEIKLVQVDDHPTEILAPVDKADQTHLNPDKIAALLDVYKDFQTVPQLTVGQMNHARNQSQLTQLGSIGSAQKQLPDCRFIYLNPYQASSFPLDSQHFSYTFNTEEFKAYSVKKEPEEVKHQIKQEEDFEQSPVKKPFYSQQTYPFQSMPVKLMRERVVTMMKTQELHDSDAPAEIHRNVFIDSKHDSNRLRQDDAEQMQTSRVKRRAQLKLKVKEAPAQIPKLKKEEVESDCVIYKVLVKCIYITEDQSLNNYLVEMNRDKKFLAELKLVRFREDEWRILLCHYVLYKGEFSGVFEGIGEVPKFTSFVQMQAEVYEASQNFMQYQELQLEAYNLVIRRVATAVIQFKDDQAKLDFVDLTFAGPEQSPPEDLPVNDNIECIVVQGKTKVLRADMPLDIQADSQSSSPQQNDAQVSAQHPLEANDESKPLENDKPSDIMMSDVAEQL